MGFFYQAFPIAVELIPHMQYKSCQKNVVTNQYLTQFKKGTDFHSKLLNHKR